MGQENFDEFYKEHRAELEEAEDNAVEKYTGEEAEKNMPEVIENFENLLKEEAEKGKETKSMREELESVKILAEMLLNKTALEQFREGAVNKDSDEYRALKALERRAEYNKYHSAQLKAQKVLDRFNKLVKQHK